MRDESGDRAGDQAERPVGGGDRQSERAGDPNRRCGLDALHVEAALEDHRAAEKADPGEEALELPTDRYRVDVGEMILGDSLPASPFGAATGSGGRGLRPSPIFLASSWRLAA
jgi:hypothetical protein